MSGDASCCFGGRHGEGVVAEAGDRVKAFPEFLDAVDSEMIPEAASAAWSSGRFSSKPKPAAHHDPVS